MFRRERDARRTAKSVRTHEGTMEALRRATSGEYNPNAAFAPKQGDAHFDGGDLVMTSKDGKMFRNNVRKSNARGKTPMPPSKVGFDTEKPRKSIRQEPLNGGYSYIEPPKTRPKTEPSKEDWVAEKRERDAERKSQQPDTGNEKEMR